MLTPTRDAPPSDGALARRITAARPGRDAQAEALLCQRLGPRARLYGLRHLRDPHAANDLAQEVLMMTLQRLRDGTVRDPEQIASFMLGACRQMVVDRRRGERRRERLLDIYADDVPVAAVPSGPLLDQDRLRHCLDCLPERERSVLLMSFYDDRPAPEIAAELGTSAANIRVIRHRGIERLRDCLGVAGDAP